jgi:hypothetical protein
MCAMMLYSFPGHTPLTTVCFFQGDGQVLTGGEDAIIRVRPTKHGNIHALLRPSTWCLNFAHHLLLRDFAWQVWNASNRRFKQVSNHLERLKKPIDFIFSPDASLETKFLCAGSPCDCGNVTAKLSSSQSSLMSSCPRRHWKATQKQSLRFRLRERQR